jgi:hypothetical protein
VPEVRPKRPRKIQMHGGPWILKRKGGGEHRRHQAQAPLIVSSLDFLLSLSSLIPQYSFIFMIPLTPYSNCSHFSPKLDKVPRLKNVLSIFQKKP